MGDPKVFSFAAWHTQVPGQTESGYSSTFPRVTWLMLVVRLLSPQNGTSLRAANGRGDQRPTTVDVIEAREPMCHRYHHGARCKARIVGPSIGQGVVPIQSYHWHGAGEKAMASGASRILSSVTRLCLEFPTSRNARIFFLTSGKQGRESR